MKKLIFLAIIFLGFNCIKAQTYISPMIGYDFTDMRTNDDELAYVHISEQKYGVNNLTFGLRIKQKIFKKIEIIGYSSYSRRYAEGWFFSVAPIDGMEFNYFQNGLQCNYLLNKFYFGLGANYNILTSLTLTYEKKKRDYAFLKEINEQGIRFVLGKNHKNFNLEAYFYKGLTSNFDNKGIMLFPINSLGLSLSYDIKVFNGFKKKTKAECPKF